jgi:cytochrome o ubiquinol oxidase operon protein cyoD
MDDNQTRDGAIKGSVVGYVAGFGLSLLLTLVAFFLVAHRNSKPDVFTHRFLMVSIVALAIVQLFVQLLFFLHLDRESKPRWNLLVAGFAAMVVLILVAGSLWIMNNLNYHHEATPSDKYIIKDENIHPH